MVLGTKRTIDMYTRRGFNVTNIHVDDEFRCVWDAFIPCHLNIAAAKEHVGEIEWSVRTVKEVTQCITYTLPFKCIP